MAAGLALGRATVSRTEPPGADLYERVSVLVRSNVLRITSRTGELLVEDTGVTMVEVVDRRTYRVVTNTATYTVVKASGCGCGE